MQMTHHHEPRRRAPLAALAAGCLSLFASAAAAQQTLQLSRTTITIGAGAVFPSGGDLNDTYAPGAAFESAATLPMTSRLALRVDAGYARFAPSPAPQHAGRDPHMGFASSAQAGLRLDLRQRGTRAPLYAIVGGGRSKVGLTWLDPRNIIEPYSRDAMWCWEAGFGGEVTDRFGLEIRRIVAHRERRGVVSYVPVMLSARI
jgi:hypothetical protein